MSIQKGDPIPEARLFDLDDSGALRAVSASERFAGKRIVLFAVPGAFTRTCSEKHLPSFVQYADALKAQGIDEIVCVAVNDAMVLAAWARERFGNAAVDRLYLALGRARHERKDSLADPAVIERALTEAGLDPTWRTEAAAEPGMEERILAEHQEGVERLKAFGVPMLSVNGGRGFFGPVITSVPTGEDAGELWDHIAWLAARDDVFEYKRSRR
jgi:hypothetical protein